VLYAAVVLSSAKQCTLTLRMLGRRPELARHVRELVIRQNPKNKTKFCDEESDIASSAVRELAAARRLDALTTFVWEGSEMPYHEDMWFALRML
jgi:hypothetical protein